MVCAGLTKHSQHTEEQGRAFIVCRRTLEEGTVSKNRTLLKKKGEDFIWGAYMYGFTWGRHLGMGTLLSMSSVHSKTVQEEKITECPQTLERSRKGKLVGTFILQSPQLNRNRNLLVTPG